MCFNMKKNDVQVLILSFNDFHIWKWNFMIYDQGFVKGYEFCPRSCDFYFSLKYCQPNVIERVLQTKEGPQKNLHFLRPFTI